ncbi:branched-chain amino acid ABC transporter permease [Magnetospira thiophila]
MRRLLHPKTGGLGLLAAVILSLPLVMNNPFHLEVAVTVGLNAIVCVGLNLLIGYAGQISLGHAAFVGLGAYGAGVLTAHHQWDSLSAMGMSALGTGLLAFVVARPILKLKGHYLAMATLGLGIIIAIVLNIEDQITGGPDGMVVPALNLWGWEPAGEIQWYWMVGGLLWIAVWLALNLIDSPVGRALRAVHGSEVAAEVVGIDSSRYKVLIFVVSAVFASLVGSLNAFYGQFITPGIASFFHSIEFVVMVVLGGMASTFGAVIGALILTLLPQVLTVLEDYEHLIFGLILMGVMIFMPKGLLPTLSGLLTRRKP